ncbi:unnamed protein product, partial [Dovyalis caffra]
GVDNKATTKGDKKATTKRTTKGAKGSLHNSPILLNPKKPSKQKCRMEEDLVAIIAIIPFLPASHTFGYPSISYSPHKEPLFDPSPKIPKTTYGIIIPISINPLPRNPSPHHWLSSLQPSQ